MVENRRIWWDNWWRELAEGIDGRIGGGTGGTIGGCWRLLEIVGGCRLLKVREKKKI